MTINTTTDTVQKTIDSTIGTATYTYSNHSYNAEKGWECPRCGRINAPWVRQCDCSPSTSTLNKITVDPCDNLWKTKITCDDNIIYTTHVAGGSDSVTGDWVNVPKTYTNSVKR